MKQLVDRVGRAGYEQHSVRREICELREFDAFVARLKQHPDLSDYEALCAEGSLLSWEQALEEAFPD